MQYRFDASTMSSSKALELRCMEPENYKKYFCALYWSENRRIDKKNKPNGGKKDKRRVKAACSVYLNQRKYFSILPNPSQFVVYAAIRKAVLSRWNFLPTGWEGMDDGDFDDGSSQAMAAKLSKVTSVGLRTVFALISHARLSHNELCEHALKALLDVLQGHAPEELSAEPNEIICNIHSILVELASGNGPRCRSDTSSILTTLSSSCLIALAVARGETELILDAVASLVMHPMLSDQVIQVPSNLTTLQKSVQWVILGSPSRNLWLNHGVPHQALVNSFFVELPSQLKTRHDELIVRSLVSDGCFLYVYTSKGLLKIGSGYGSSIKQHVYMYKPNFFASDRHGWLGFCKNKLYLRIGRKNTDIYEIDVDTLDVRNLIKLSPGETTSIEPKIAIFTDSNQLGLITLSNNVTGKFIQTASKKENLTIRMYNVDVLSANRPEGSVLSPNKEMNVHLLRKRTIVFGRAPYEDGLGRRYLDFDKAMQLEDNDDDPLFSICSGLEFGLLTTVSGKVYYTGKAQTLGYKMSNSGRWTLMNEPLLTRTDLQKRSKVIQVAVGHEGVHAILVLDTGVALFTGVARRCEDGDTSKHRRAPKPARPKKMTTTEGHHIIYAACNYGSTALVTQQGLLFMYGKDTQHCDANGLVNALCKEKIVQVALGKAHAVTLTNQGQVFTFGINNKGQCGREFGLIKEKIIPSRRHRQENEPRICAMPNHIWLTDNCKICVLCHECTGFSSSCRCTEFPHRIPKEECGCGEGDSGCSVCGICRPCAETVAADRERNDTDDEDQEAFKYFNYDMPSGSGDNDRESGVKLSCLAPAHVPVPGGHKVISIAAGLHHTVLLTELGEVLTFGSNVCGQLGVGDVSVHNRIVRVRIPKAQSIAAGSNHTAVLTKDGELFTFGSYDKGALGRPRMDEPVRPDRFSMWFATPGRVPCIGPNHSCKAVWVTASGEQTYVQVSQTLIKTDFLFSATITANSNSIVILPNRPEHTFKCVTINRSDASCHTWTGPEQVDFVNSLACLDPLYDLLWCYQPAMRVMKCYNIQVFDPNVLQRCSVNKDIASPATYEIDHQYPNCGTLKTLEDFKNLDTVEVFGSSEERAVDGVAMTNMSVLNPELAIPCVQGCFLTRMHVALHLLGCLDSLTYAHDHKLNLCECKAEDTALSTAPTKEEYLTINRFENHGGGWGYSGHSVEAIRFMCDTEIVLGGYGLFGGRGDYTAKIKLFDLGPDGGDLEGDGELIAESDEVIYECAPRDKYPLLFDTPVTILPNRWYVAMATINGPSSDCGSSGLAVVIKDDIGFHFKTSKRSNNGTDVNSGQIPCLLYNTVNGDHSPIIKHQEEKEPVVTLTKNLSRKVTVPCFKAIIKLLRWSWDTYKICILDTNGQLTINYEKLQLMKHQKRLVYIIKACLRLLRSYINEIYPQSYRKRLSNDYMSYFEAIAEVRSLVQCIMMEPTPNCTMLPKKQGKNKTLRVCYVQFALEMTNSILKECHETISSCFHAFFPTPTLKWTHLCSLLFHVTNGVSPSYQIRELTSTCGAMCVSRSLRDVLHYVIPLTQSALQNNDNKRPDSKVIPKPSASLKSATVPRSSSHGKPPPIPPRAGNRDSQPKLPDSKTNYTDWHLLDVLQTLMDIVMMPMKQQMTERNCGQAHDHGEMKQQERFSKYCCQFAARIVAELAHGATVVKEDTETSNSSRYMTTPSRFMRVNQNRTWNTENGSPDAICFITDRQVSLVGVCVYGGIGTYEYELELLQDVWMRPPVVDSHMSYCWLSVDVAHGTYVSTESQHDLVQLKFDRPIPLKVGIHYAVRLWNQGGRTINGDCGLPIVRGPDGTAFRFSSCSLSFNGTSLERGQIPCLIYCGSSKPQGSSGSDQESLLPALKSLTIKVGSIIIERATELLCTLRNELSTEDLRRNASVLQQSPFINILIPYTLASLEGLSDAKSVVQLLEMIHSLLPHVAALNLLIPSNEEQLCAPPTTAGQYYAWAESEHPYSSACVTNIRVLFPSTVSCIVLEMDPRSITSQPEDSLIMYAVAGGTNNKCHCVKNNKDVQTPFKKRVILVNNGIGDIEDFYDAGMDDSQCLHYNCTYVAITQKLANVAAEWPRNAILMPGNEVVFSLETATDYLTDYNNQIHNAENHFGFRCLCVGYEDIPFTSQRQGLLALEMELASTGAASAAKLLAPDLDIPSLTQAIVLEVQHTSVIGASTNADAEDGSADVNESFISRGLELTSPPSVHQILEGQPLLRCMTAERQFLMDFVAGTESTAGYRLFRWLSPTSCVEPAKCELQPPSTPPRPAQKATLPIILRDQDGEIVLCPAITIEVMVQRIEEGPRRSQASTSQQPYLVLPDVPFHPPVRDSMRFQAISMMRAYHKYSFEEIRYLCGRAEKAQCSGAASNEGRLPTERLTVRCLPDGTFVASWIPQAVGQYRLCCVLDDQPTVQELLLEVTENCSTEESNTVRSESPILVPPTPNNLCEFIVIDSAGLRIRASPSLQAEEHGRIPRGSSLSFVEEITNKDGKWVRLSSESIRAYSDGLGGAWCLQFDNHHARTLLKVIAPQQDEKIANIARDRFIRRTRILRSSESPPSTRPSSCAHATRKLSLSPAQVECLRSLFASLLWHEGLVHDAIACATFLKFHPDLPKQGATVATRAAHDVSHYRPQRHSIEVTTSGQYLRNQAASSESLAHSNMEFRAGSSQTIVYEILPPPIREEDPHTVGEENAQAVSFVNVLPPALRALVALWDSLTESDQLAAATNKYKYVGGDYFSMYGPKKRTHASSRFPVPCDLCGSGKQPEYEPQPKEIQLAINIALGVSEPPEDDDILIINSQASNSTAFYCANCREKAAKASKAKAIELGYQPLDTIPEVDHHVMRENAMFLLDLAPLNVSEPITQSPTDPISKGPRSAVSSIWQPAPPFQSLAAWGAQPYNSMHNEAAKYHSLGRANAPVVNVDANYVYPSTSTAHSHVSRVPRSVSMGNTAVRDFDYGSQPPSTSNDNAHSMDVCDTLAGAGLSLLSQPSPQLQRLLGCGEWNSDVIAFEQPKLNPDELIRRPAITFSLARRDIHAHRQRMDALIRINTIRQFAFEAFNWLLRSATQPTCVHDVMWWFCNVISQHANVHHGPPLDVKKEASTSSLCPGGRSGRGSRAAFHAFLGSVSVLAASLPNPSAAALQAVRCWAMNYSTHDRAFLHRSQVFSVISKILSHSEELGYEAAMIGTIQESPRSYLKKECYVYSCADITSWCDLTVSSSHALIPSLTDGSTETFWESGEEDRNKAKWIQITYPGGAPEDRPQLVCLHMDNTRDIASKVLLVSFMFSSGADEMAHMQDIEVDPRNASWVKFTIPKSHCTPLRVRCELRGPEPSVRVRQVRVLSAPFAERSSLMTCPSTILHKKTDADTLKVFRLLTSQVFEKLLEWGRNNGSDLAESLADEERVNVVDDSDLREHLVGILFAGHKLTSLQRAVMTHIVEAIGSEATHARDDWETAMICADANAAEGGTIIKTPSEQDGYCFEMLSLLLALSGSSAGRATLAQSPELLKDLLSLLHTGSERVQRQVIALLRRMVAEIPPQKMLNAINSANLTGLRLSIIDHLISYLSKAITIQVKVKGIGVVSPITVTMETCLRSSPNTCWFMRGQTNKDHAQLVAKLLSDMAENKVSAAWVDETKMSLAGYISRLAQIAETDRHFAACSSDLVMWQAIASLCVCEESYMDVLKSSVNHERNRDSTSSVETHMFCVNHDDGTTTAVIDCKTCGPLCPDCDRFLHLNRVARTHQRRICKEEETAIRIDIHEGCGRAKLFWLLLLVDRRTLKGVAEFRTIDVACTGAEINPVGYPTLAGVCRFCGATGNTGLLAIGNVCADLQCQEHSKDACVHVLNCGHLCNGVRGEKNCLPCLFGCGGISDKPLRQDADDMCMICFTDPLQAAPTIQLKCGHLFHLHCCKKVLNNKWNGPRITFAFSQCPICKENMSHWALEDLLTPIRQLRDEVRRKAVMRLEYEGLTAPSDRTKYADPDSYAMERYAYYICYKCSKAFFGGLARCEAELAGNWDPAELVCGACSDVTGTRSCPKHGTDFLEYKCRYCCTVAVYFCFGTSHFCNGCHDDFQKITSIPKHQLPHCPAGPKAEQLPGTSDECPLHVAHPPSGEEFALGCGVCRHSHVF